MEGEGVGEMIGAGININDLRPCPFCGSPVIELNHGEDQFLCVRCKECGAQSGMVSYFEPDVEMRVVEGWNRRLQHDHLKTLFESECQRRDELEQAVYLNHVRGLVK